MKNYIIIILVAGILTTSCSNWLDLKPETQATESQVFSTGNGYRTVLSGLYKAMTDAQLYGRELSFGMVDCISQQYDLTLKKPSSLIYTAANGFDYQSNDLHPLIEDIWKKSFNIVANANNLLQNIQGASPDLFKDGEIERRVIMGEAYACRAMMHFDLLRLFAPAPVNDDGQVYVPYVEQYPNVKASRIDVSTFLGKVITDLELARNLVMDFDTTTIGLTLMATPDSRFFDKRSSGMPTDKVEPLYQGRGYHLNYYSITALLARVYLYAGKYKEATEYAAMLPEFQMQASWWTYTMFSDNFNGLSAGNEETKSDFRVRSNLIFALYNDKAYEDYDLNEYFRKNSNNLGVNYLVINKDNQKIFENKQQEDESGLDVRARYQIFNADSRYPLSGKYYCSADQTVRDKNLSTIPMIRLTEMYYIMAECHARQGNWGKAKEILESVRSKRGCSKQLNISNWAEFEEELIRDARREWISEGQLFYLYKRLNANVDFGKNVVRPLKREEYLLPVSDSQTF